VVDSQVIACNKGKYSGSGGIVTHDNFNVIKNTVVAHCYLKGIHVSYGRSVLENNVIAGTLT